jgi:uncharacterized membrane protein YphA (DoxX/SURF4 family)
MLAFCRAVIVLVFALSSVSKAVDIAQFKQTIHAFHLLPERFSRLAALLFLSGEFTVVLLVALGGSLLFVGFVLAVGLLLLFCFALMTVLARNIRTSCHCFGPGTKQVSRLDIWRNIGFIVCALVGSTTLPWIKGSQGAMGLGEWILIGLAATVFVVIWTQLEEITHLF